MFFEVLVVKYQLGGVYTPNASALNKVYAKSFVDVLTSCANLDFTPHPCNAFNSVANSSFKFQHLVVQLKQAHQEGNHCTYFSGKIRNNYSDSLVLYLDPPNFVVNQLLADVWVVSMV